MSDTAANNNQTEKSQAAGGAGAAGAGGADPHINIKVKA